MKSTRVKEKEHWSKSRRRMSIEADGEEAGREVSEEVGEGAKMEEEEKEKVSKSRRRMS
jgi:hypothetical protein